MPSLSSTQDSKGSSEVKEGSDIVEHTEFSGKRWVWLPDEAHAFIKGFVASQDGLNLTVRCTDGSDRLINEGEADAVNPTKFDKSDNVAELTYLNEASVVHNLYSRYKSDLIYTYSGLFLVAVNPYKTLPIYNKAYIDMYRKAKNDTPKPHVFAISDLAYRNMLEMRENQSILVTGESGAGKTENTKKVIQYLAAVARHQKSDSIPKSFESQIQQANPILESFGNAQTSRNNNSSRFGKFIRIGFQDGEICGASIDWYLLEKSRVVLQNSSERNYHIFYQLLSSDDRALLEELKLTATVDDYEYLKHSNKHIRGVSDSEEYSALLKAFQVMNFTDDEITGIFRVIAAVLLIGNLEIVSESSEQARFANVEQAKVLCEVFGIQSNSFCQSILHPRVKAGRDWVTQSRNKDQVRYSLDALAKSCYERLFGHIVGKINHTLDGHGCEQSFIGVLDIAGFEIFESNSFEQLCINYTNEKLQQFFNHHMFVLEQEEYSREQISWDFMDFGQDLQPTIDLIEKSNPVGIFSCLDEDCVMPKATDKSFTEKLNSLWNKNSNKFHSSRFKQGFILTHYAADVEYSTDGWLEKNKDPLNESVALLLSQSKRDVFANLFANEAESPINAPGKKVKRGLFRTVAQRHKEQLSSLMMQLHSTHPHFIRCIIPNQLKRPGLFDNPLVLDQLRCNGVLEGIRIARSGFPNRLPFSDFRQRYQILADKFISPETNDQKACSTMLDNMSLDPSLYRVGLTKVFFRSGVLAQLEEQRETFIQTIIGQFQSIARGHLKRRIVRKQLYRNEAGALIRRNMLQYVALQKNPWWSLFLKIRPLLSDFTTSQENAHYQNLIEDLEQRNKSFETEKSDAQHEVERLRKQVKSLESKIQSERQTALDKEEILKRSQERETDLEKQLSATLLELDKLESNCEQLLQAKKKVDEQAEMWRGQLEKGAGIIGNLEHEKTELKAKIEDLEVTIAKGSDRKVSNKDEMQRLTQEVKFLKSCLNQKDSKLRELEEKLAHSDKELEEKLKTVTHGYELSSKRSRELLRENRELRDKLTDSGRSVSDYEALISRKESELNQTVVKVREQEQEMDAMRLERTELQSKYDAVAFEIRQTRSEMATLRTKYQKLREEAEKSKKILEENAQEDLRVCCEQLREQLKASQLLVLRERKQGSEAIAEAHAKVARLQSSEEVLKIDLKNLTEEISKKSMISDEHEQVLAQLTNDKATLQSELLNLSKDLQSAKIMSEDADARRINSESQLETLKNEVRVKQSMLATLEREKACHVEELKSLKSTKSLLTNESQTLLSRKNELETELEAMKAELSSGKQSLESAESRIAELETKITSSDSARLSQHVKRAEEELNVWIQKYEYLDQEYKMAIEQRERLASEITSLRTQKTSRPVSPVKIPSRDSATDSPNSKSKDREIERLIVMSNGLKTNVAALTLELRERNEQVSALQKALSSTETPAKNIRADDSAYALKLSELQKRLRESEEGRRQALRRVDLERKSYREDSPGFKSSRMSLEEIPEPNHAKRVSPRNSFERLGSPRASKVASMFGDTEVQRVMKENEEFRRILKLHIAKNKSLSEEIDFKNSSAQDIEKKLKGYKSKDDHDSLLNELSNLEIQLEDEQTKSNDLVTSLDIYKSRSEEYHSKLESAEMAIISATRAENTFRAQYMESEESLKRARKEHAETEQALVVMRNHKDDLEEKLADRNLEINQRELTIKRLMEELQVYRSRQNADSTEQGELLSKARETYQHQLSTISSELDNERLLVTNLRSDKAEAQKEMQRIVSEWNEGQQTLVALRKEKSKLEADFENVRASHQASLLASEESQGKIDSLMSQVHSLRATMDEITTDRDNLQRDKKSLELRLSETVERFESLMKTQNGAKPESVRLTKDIVALRSELAHHKDAAADTLRKYERANTAAKEMESLLKDKRIQHDNLVKEKMVLEQSLNQTKGKLKNMEAKAARPEDDDVWRNKFYDLEKQMEDQSKEHSEKLRAARSSERSLRELQSQLDQKTRLTERVNEELNKSQVRVKSLLQNIQDLQSSETAHQLAARRAEREAKEAKEKALRLEKELVSRRVNSNSPMLRSSTAGNLRSTKY